jgi:hypothetical protein
MVLPMIGCGFSIDQLAEDNEDSYRQGIMLSYDNCIKDYVGKFALTVYNFDIINDYIGLTGNCLLEFVCLPSISMRNGNMKAMEYLSKYKEQIIRLKDLDMISLTDDFLASKLSKNDFYLIYLLNKFVKGFLS